MKNCLNYSTQNIRRIAAIMLFMMIAVVLSAQQAGDFRTKWVWDYYSNPAVWQSFDGDNWVDANQLPPSPFQSTIYIDHTIVFDSDFVLDGDMIMASGTTLYVNTGYDFTVSAGASFALTNILMNKGTTLYNYGTITSCTCGATITLQHTDNSGLSAVLVNMGTIELRDDDLPYTHNLTMNDGSVFISGADAYVWGTGSIANTAQGVRFEIANPGGYEDAIRLTGPHHIEQAHYVFNGSVPQVTGNIGDMLLSLTIDNPAGVTMQKHLDVNPWNNAEIRVTSGSTLHMGHYTINSSDWGNASFILEPGATVSTSHPEGISSEAVNQKIAFGAIRTNLSSYSSEANYMYTGSSLQQSGNFITEPDPYTVNNLTVTNTFGLVLSNPLLITGTLSGGQYIQGDYTLPVTLASFTAFQYSGRMVRIQWATSSETNVLGYYILRSEENDLAQAIRVSPLMEAANSSQGSTYQFVDRELHQDGTYYYWLEDLGIAEEGSVYGPLKVTVRADGGNQSPEVALQPGMNGNFPNPFNPTSTLRFTLPQSGDARIIFYNTKGQVVDTMNLPNSVQGKHQMVWNTQSLNLPSGVYYARLRAPGVDDTQKLTLSK